MRKLLNIIKSPLFISIIGLICLSIIVWFAGPSIKLGAENYAPFESSFTRLLIIFVIFAIWVANQFRIMYMQNKNNNHLIDDLQQSESPDEFDGSLSREELKTLGDRFNNAMSTLRKVRFSGAKSKGKAIYQLPWYIIIGPPGSGKTTALVNSGLEFPLSDEIGKTALQGIGGTRNCDWWFTNEAVLIDTAGRYTTQDSHRQIDSAAWKGFLNMLKKNRLRRPINGAIIAISLQDMLLQTEEERAWHAKTIRNRIDELITELGVNFPVYILLTKTDLLPGFVEYFNDYGLNDRNNIFGITFDKSRVDTDFDWWSDEYDQMVMRLYDSVLPKMNMERDVNRRNRIQQFPQEVDRLKQIVEQFLRAAFVTSQFQNKPLLRGVYFSSGTQDGTPIDRIMSNIAQNYGIKNDVVNSNYSQGKSYFISKLFSDIIFKESELVGSNKKIETMFSWGRRIGYISLVGIFVGTLSAWTASIASNQLLIKDIDTHLDKYQSEKRKINEWNYDLHRVLPALNSLKNAASVYDAEQHPWLNNIGLYDPSVDQRVDALYDLSLSHLFKARFRRLLEKSVKSYLSAEPGKLYDALKVYLMFDDPVHFDKQYINDWLKLSLKELYSNKLVVQDQIYGHLQRMFDTSQFQLDLSKTLVSQARSRLDRIPVSNRIYQRLKSIENITAPVNIGNYLGEKAFEIFTYDKQSIDKFSVPYMFTKNGYSNMDFSIDSPIMEHIMNDDWVLSSRHNQPYDNSQKEAIILKVKALYLAEYIQHWNHSLAALDMNHFTNMRDASNKLAILSDEVYSPVARTLDVVHANTELTPFVPVDIPGASDESIKGKLKAGAAGLASGLMEGNKVDKQFRKLNNLNRETNNNPPPINKSIRMLSLLYSYMNEILASPDPGKSAFAAAKTRFQGNQADVFRKVRIHAASLPEPVSKWMLVLADESWKVVLQNAHSYIQKKWRDSVYSYYQNGIANRYPVFKKAENDLEIYDFAEFFKPKGVIDEFTTTYLNPFVNKSSRWTKKRLDGREIGISSRTLKQIQKAEKIRTAFFKSDQEIPAFSFKSRPQAMDKDISRFVLDMGGEKYLYRHGPKFWKRHDWPGGEESQRVSVYFEKTNNEIVTAEFEGAWAWFKLLDQSYIQTSNKPNTYNVTYRVGETAAEYELKSESYVNPLDPSLLNSFRIAKTI